MQVSLDESCLQGSLGASRFHHPVEPFLLSYADGQCQIPFLSAICEAHLHCRKYLLVQIFSCATCEAHRHCPKYSPMQIFSSATCADRRHCLEYYPMQICWSAACEARRHCLEFAPMQIFLSAAREALRHYLEFPPIQMRNLLRDVLEPLVPFVMHGVPFVMLLNLRSPRNVWIFLMKKSLARFW